jgi:hypothetical protein
MTDATMQTAPTAPITTNDGVPLKQSLARATRRQQAVDGAPADQIGQRGRAGDAEDKADGPAAQNPADGPPLLPPGGDLGGERIGRGQRQPRRDAADRLRGGQPEKPRRKGRQAKPGGHAQHGTDQRPVGADPVDLRGEQQRGCRGAKAKGRRRQHDGRGIGAGQVGGHGGRDRAQQQGIGANDRHRRRQKPDRPGCRRGGRHGRPRPTAARPGRRVRDRV